MEEGRASSRGGEPVKEEGRQRKGGGRGMERRAKEWTSGESLSSRAPDLD